MGIKSLAELRCTDSSQACQVTVWVEDAQGAKRAPHSICATLKPDGSREYRIDSRIKSGKEVRVKLSGIPLPGQLSAACMKRASMAPKQDPRPQGAPLAEINVKRWRDETAAAHRELSGTRKALGEISNNITHLEAAAACNNEKMAALSASAKLDRQIYEAQVSTAALLTASRRRCSSELEAAGAKQSLLREKLEQQESELRQLDSHIEQEQSTAQKLPDLGQLQAQQQVASSEEEVRLLKVRMQQPKQVQEELDDISADIRRLGVQAASSATLAEQLTPHITRLEQLAIASGERSDAVDMAAELDAQTTKLDQKRKQVQACAQELCEASQAAADSAASAERLARQEMESAGKAAQASAALPSTQAALERNRAAVTACAQKAEGLRQQRQRLQVCLGMLAGNTAPPPHRMLHECFTLRSPASFNRDLLRPLDVILGHKARIAIVRATQEASDLLMWRNSDQQVMDRSLRIWPADTLRHKDVSGQQRKACAALAAGRVYQPLDVLVFDGSDETVMKHAFGSMLIAADADTAAELATRHGLASVTLEGRVSRPGSLQGGWQGSTSRSQTATTILEISRIRAEEVDVARRLEALDLEAAALQQRQRQLQEDVDANLVLCLSVRQAEQNAEATALKAKAAKGALVALEAEVEQSSSNLKHLERLQKKLEDAKGDDVDMNKQLIELRATLAGHQAVADRCQHQLEEQEDCALELEESLNMMDRPTLENRLQKARSILQTHRERLRALQAESTAQREQQQQQRKQLELLQQKRLQAQEAHERTQAAIKAAVDAAAQIEKQRQWLQQEACQLDVKVAPDQQTRAVQGNLAEDLTAYKKQKAKLKFLQAERQACLANSISETEQALHAERVRKLAAFKEQAQCMRQAVELVEQGMAAMTLQVERTKEAVFSGMAEQFGALSKGLIPAVELRLSWVGKGEGVYFQWRHHDDKSGSHSWQADLAQLSGGQRSLIAIALLVAAAKAGSRSRLFLLDEVDAALDESNQAVVASLMRQLCEQSCCQCLAVTHSAAFQANCDTLVQVSCGGGGTTFSAAGFEPEKDRKRPRL